MDRNSLGPQALSYKELAKGALYNAAQPNRQETRGPAIHHSLEHLRLPNESRGSFADLSAGHLYNPTSSVHEVDPPTWPAHGMENVGSSSSPFKSYRLERPPSPILGKRYSMTYQGRGPSHNTVASGVLFNPYVRGRLPAELDTDSARLFANSSFELSRSTSKVNRIYQPTPVTSVPLKAKLELSTSSHGSDQKEYDNSSLQRSQYPVPKGSYPPPGHLGASGTSRQFSIRSNASQLQSVNPNTGAQGGLAMYMHPSQARTRTDDSIYYHPSREHSVHQAQPPFHADDNKQNLLPSHSRTISPGSMSSIGSATVIRSTPWMQQENMNATAFDSIHPSRAHSPTDESMYYHPGREHTARTPSSLHHEYGDPVALGSAHPSRAPSNHDGASTHLAIADAPSVSRSSSHPSRVPTVIRDSVAVQEGWGGDAAQDHFSPAEHIPSRVPTAGKGSIRAADSIRNFQTSRTPSATTHVARFQEQYSSEVYPKVTSRSPSAASRASQIQRHVGASSRIGTPAPIDEEGTEAQQHFEQHFEQVRTTFPGVGSVHASRAPSVLNDANHSPLPLRAPSAADDAASYHSRVPSRAGSAVGANPSQHTTLTRRGRASRLGRGSGRATPIAVPEEPGSASVYRISVIDASDDGKGLREGNE